VRRRSAAANKVSFDHFVRARQQSGRDIDAKRTRGLQVEGEFEFGRLLHQGNFQALMSQMGQLLSRDLIRGAAVLPPKAAAALDDRPRQFWAISDSRPIILPGGGEGRFRKSVI
jgi:phage terminase large subunit-like protein